MDYRNFSKDGSPLTDGPNGTQKQWWKLEDKEQAQAIAMTLAFLYKRQANRQTQYILAARLYGNLTVMGLNGITYSKISSIQNNLKDRISYNVCQSVVDTITAKIAKNKPKPLFLTSGGNYKLQRKAKKLNQFVEGIFYENNAHDLGVEIFRDGTVWGDGVIHPFINKEGRLEYERVLPMEIWVDEIEAFYGQPRQLHRVKNVDRQVMIDMYPEFKEALMDLNQARPDEGGAGYPNVADLITVAESWHLRSGPDCEDGKHVISVDGHTLFEEEYDCDYFPFVWFHWNKRLFGYWGQGLVEQIQSIQLEINKLLWIIQRSFHLSGTFKVFIENGSKIVKEHLNSDIGAIVNFTGTMPQYVTPPIVQAEIFQHLQTLKTSAYECAGISQLSAQSQKPAGLNSGKALREFNDIESDRFMTIGKQYERFFLDLSKMSIDIIKQTAKNGKYIVKAPSKREMIDIDWREVNIPEDNFIMQCYPVSSLPNDPAGRLQTVQEYIQAGFLSPREGQRLLDFPDLDAIENLKNSSQDYLHEIFEKMVEDGEYTPPEPFDDLQLAREMAMQYYSQGKCSNLDEEKLELLRRFMGQIDMLQAAAQPPMPPQGMPGSPQAAPMPQPTSDLVQNVPGQPGM